MADTPGEGGGISICNVSPSDQAGQINNILERLTNCEIAIARLAGLDVSATNASDIVESLGTITNGTIIMPDNSVTGWTNSIPPGDFTGSILSNGVLTTWNNGVVSFEVQSSGVTTGGGVKYLKRAGGYMGATPSSGATTQLSLASPADYEDTIGATMGSTSFSLPRSGYYFVSANLYVYESFNPTTFDFSFEIYDSSYPGTSLQSIQSWVSDGTGNYSQEQHINLSGILQVAASSNIYLETVTSFTGGATLNILINDLSVIEL